MSPSTDYGSRQQTDWAKPGVLDYNELNAREVLLSVAPEIYWCIVKMLLSFSPETNLFLMACLNLIANRLRAIASESGAHATRLNNLQRESV